MCFFTGSILDRSSEWIRAILLNGTIKELPHISQLHTYMKRMPAEKLVLSDWVLQTKVSPGWQQHCIRVSDYQARSVALCLDAILDFDMRTEGSEMWTADAVNNTVLAVIKMLDKVFPEPPTLEEPSLPSLQLKCRVERNCGDSDSLSTLLSDKGQPMRPDISIRLGDGVRMLSKGEEKDWKSELKVRHGVCCMF
jgi:hypothetical protein